MERLRKMVEWLEVTAAALLPRRVVYFATIRLIAHATTGRYSRTVTDEITALDALKRWEG